MDIGELKKNIGSEYVIAMLAPSFPVDFDFEKIVHVLKIFGFKKVVELTFAAKIVNEEYHNIISNGINKWKKNQNEKPNFIASVCPLIVSYVKTKYPNKAKYLMPVVSPMVAMNRIVKNSFNQDEKEGNVKTCFIGPCTAKKIEAREMGVDYAITFQEFSDEYDKIVKENEIKKIDFDKFYNDFTKIYPLAGGLSDTLHYKNILSKDEISCADGVNNLDNALKKDVIFYDLLFCDGGCVGGPGVKTKAPLFIRYYKIKGYKNFSKTQRIGKQKGLDKYVKGLNFRRSF